MTRREFIQRLLSAVPVIMTGAYWLVKKAVPRRFTHAGRLKNYPGAIKPLRNINNQGSWKG